MRPPSKIAFFTIEHSPCADIVFELIDGIQAGPPAAELGISKYGVLDGLAGEELEAMLAAEPAFIASTNDGRSRRYLASLQRNPGSAILAT